MLGSSDMPGSHIVMPPYTVPTAITFCKNQYSYQHYWCCLEFHQCLWEVNNNDSEWVTLTTEEQCSWIVQQLQIWGSFTLQYSPVAMQICFTITIVQYHRWPHNGQTNRSAASKECHRHQHHSVLSNRSKNTDQSRTSQFRYVPIQSFMKKVFRNTMAIYDVAGYLPIHGATGWWTIRALSGDLIPQIFEALRGSFNGLYPQEEMDRYLVVRQAQFDVTRMWFTE